TFGTNFTGDTKDIGSGLFDTPNRELHPGQGRWISPDPAGAGWNLYAYSTNPNGITDPSGLSGGVQCRGADRVNQECAGSPNVWVPQGMGYMSPTVPADSSSLFVDYNPSIWVNSGSWPIVPVGYTDNSAYVWDPS